MAEWGDCETTARIWYCGDDYCQCTRPEILVSGPNRIAGSPSWRHVGLWWGTFASEASPQESANQKAELAAEAKRRGIPMQRETFGQRPANAKEIGMLDAAEKDHRKQLEARGII